jgi:hypothetical protein
MRNGKSSGGSRIDRQSRQLQESNVALDICQQSKKDIMKMQASSRARRTEYVRQQRERIEEQERVLCETTARLEEREKMVHDLSELNDINRLLITRYQEHRICSKAT